MNNLRYLRKRAGLTAKKLCEMTGLKRTNYALMESGKRPVSPRTIISLTNLFDCSVGYLLGLDNEWVSVQVEGYPKSIHVDEETYQNLYLKMKESVAYLGQTFVLDTKYKSEVLGGYKVIRYVPKGELATLISKREVIKQAAKYMTNETADKVIKVIK